LQSVERPDASQVFDRFGHVAELLLPRALLRPLQFERVRAVEAALAQELKDAREIDDACPKRGKDVLVILTGAVFEVN